jgi:hypothetical protein
MRKKSARRLKVSGGENAAMSSFQGARERKSGREFSAAFGTAIGNDLAAANGCHAGAETMPTRADKFGRLIGPFHDMHSGGKRQKQTAAEPSPDQRFGARI